jgi:hypothetical protein
MQTARWAMMITHVRASPKHSVAFCAELPLMLHSRSLRNAICQHELHTGWLMEITSGALLVAQIAAEPKEAMTLSTEVPIVLDWMRDNASKERSRVTAPSRCVHYELFHSRTTRVRLKTVASSKRIGVKHLQDHIASGESERAYRALPQCRAVRRQYGVSKRGNSMRGSLSEPAGIVPLTREFECLRGHVVDFDYT